MLKKYFSIILTIGMLLSMMVVMPVGATTDKVIYYEENFDAYDLGGATSVTVNTWDKTNDKVAETELKTADGNKALTDSITITRAINDGTKNVNYGVAQKYWSYKVENMNGADGEKSQVLRIVSDVLSGTKYDVYSAGGSASTSSTNCTYWIPNKSAATNAKRFYVYKSDFTSGNGYSMPDRYVHEPNLITGGSSLKTTSWVTTSLIPWGSGSKTIANGTWYEWTYILDQQTHTAYTLIDGVLVGTRALGENISYPSNLLLAPNGPTEKVGGSAKAMSIDNVVAYGTDGTGDLAVAAIAPATLTDKLVLEFNYPVDTANIAVKYNGAAATVTYAGDDKYVVDLGALSAATKYDISVTATDMFGRQITDKAVSFTTPANEIVWRKADFENDNGDFRTVAATGYGIERTATVDESGAATTAMKMYRIPNTSNVTGTFELDFVNFNPTQKTMVYEANVRFGDEYGYNPMEQIYFYGKGFKCELKDDDEDGISVWSLTLDGKPVNAEVGEWMKLKAVVTFSGYAASNPYTVDVFVNEQFVASWRKALGTGGVLSGNEDAKWHAPYAASGNASVWVDDIKVYTVGEQASLATAVNTPADANGLFFKTNLPLYTASALKADGTAIETYSAINFTASSVSNAKINDNAATVKAVKAVNGGYLIEFNETVKAGDVVNATVNLKDIAGNTSDAVVLSANVTECGITKAELDNNTVKLTSSYFAKQPAIKISATYKNDSKAMSAVSDVSDINIRNGVSYYNSEIEIGEDEYVRYFFWDSVEGLKPLTK
ncbi:MAG: hypothetical protein II978_06565 [Clostridia bacterium]|nr:hypothetical protein [Clostridia bacterium]